MASTTDMMDTVELISNFWPDLQFSKQDLVTGNPDFINRFYSNFIAELNDKISYLINEEIINDEFDDIQEFDREVILYCKVAKVFKKLKYVGSLYLADFYRQNPKKMYPCVKFSIHFVIYINNCLDEVFNLLSEIYKKLTESENLRILKEQCLQDTAENAENVARLQRTFNTLNNKLEEVKKKHEKMVEEKLNQEKVFAEKSTEMTTLQSGIDNLEYELKLLEDEEDDFRESIITEKDYDNLRSTEKYLEIEQQRLCGDDLGTDDDINAEIENVKHLEDIAQRLAFLRLDSLDVETLHEVRQQITSSKNTQKELNDQLSSLNNTTDTMTKNIANLKQTLEKTHLCSAELKKKITLAEEDEAKCYEKEIAKCSANFEECQRLETEILFRIKEIQRIEEDESKLNATVAKEYRKILDMEKKTTNKFYNMLVNIKKLGEDGH